MGSQKKQFVFTFKDCDMKAKRRVIKAIARIVIYMTGIMICGSHLVKGEGEWYHWLIVFILSVDAIAEFACDLMDQI